MTDFEIIIDSAAINDIKEAKNWYSLKNTNIALKFQKQTISQISKLKSVPERFSLKYDDIRCMPIKKFPFLVHFSINESKRTITIHAVFHTSRNPQIWKKR